ncbi:MAG TPA: hypothetical protein VJZ27_16265, partial [Aggregatilineales bacterium]|nr:hypothetical protein [Aggregatilineales bacterium]
SIGIEEIEMSLEEVAGLMDQSMMPLHTVFDFSGAAPDEAFFDLIMRSRMVSHEQRGHCVFLKPNEFITFMAKVLRHETGTPVVMVDNEDDAWDFFSEMGIC